jgi:hypothetical protein
MRWLVSFLIIIARIAHAQFTSSNLPIIILNTNNQTIQDETRIVIDMKIMNAGPGNRNTITDTPQIQTKVSVEYRGESSLSLQFPKKSIRLETQNPDGSNADLALLGMPADNDWILYAPYTDKTLMRNVLTYTWGNQMGRYTPRTRYCEVVLNNNYQGVYVLVEKIKRDNNRVDIATLTTADVSGDELTGGYILRVDKLDDNDYPDWTITTSDVLPGENNVKFQYYQPDGDDLLPVQRDYIKNYMRQFSLALANANFITQPDSYHNYIDVNSFVDHMISTELAKNVDGYVYSTYLYKDKTSKGGKLHMGPLWDFDLGYGNVDYMANSQFAPGWTYNDLYRMFWFRRLMTDPYVEGKFSCRWHELRQSFLSDNNITKTIDSLALVLNESQQRNFNKWNILGVYVWPNQYVGATYADEINFLKEWIMDRVNWVDANLPGECVISDVYETTYNLYPNPGPSFRLQVNEQVHRNFQIVNTLGQEILSGNISSGDFFWDGLDQNQVETPAGLYWIRLSGKTDRVHRFIKTN